MTRLPVLLDCDPGHDDAIAIVVASAHTDLLGITTVAGNAPLDLTTKKLERIGSGFGGTDGLAKDARGRRFVGDWKNGKLFELVSENVPPRLLSDMFRSAADISLMPDGNTLLVPDMKAGTLTWFPVR